MAGISNILEYAVPNSWSEGPWTYEDEEIATITEHHFSFFRDHSNQFGQTVTLDTDTNHTSQSETGRTTGATAVFGNTVVTIGSSQSSWSTTHWSNGGSSSSPPAYVGTGAATNSHYFNDLQSTTEAAGISTQVKGYVTAPAGDTTYERWCRLVTTRSTLIGTVSTTIADLLYTTVSSSRYGVSEDTFDFAFTRASEDITDTREWSVYAGTLWSTYLIGNHNLDITYGHQLYWMTLASDNSDNSSNGPAQFDHADHVKNPWLQLGHTTPIQTGTAASATLPVFFSSISVTTGFTVTLSPATSSLTIAYSMPSTDLLEPASQITNYYTEVTVNITSQSASSVALDLTVTGITSNVGLSSVYLITKTSSIEDYVGESTYDTVTRNWYLTEERTLTAAKNVTIELRSTIHQATNVRSALQTTTTLVSFTQVTTTYTAISLLGGNLWPIQTWDDQSEFGSPTVTRVTQANGDGVGEGVITVAESWYPGFSTHGTTNEILMFRRRLVSGYIPQIAYSAGSEASDVSRVYRTLSVDTVSSTGGGISFDASEVVSKITPEWSIFVGWHNYDRSITLPGDVTQQWTVSTETTVKSSTINWDSYDTDASSWVFSTGTKTIPPTSTHSAVTSLITVLPHSRFSRWLTGDSLAWAAGGVLNINLLGGVYFSGSYTGTTYAVSTNSTLYSLLRLQRGAEDSDASANIIQIELKTAQSTTEWEAITLRSTGSIARAGSSFNTYEIAGGAIYGIEATVSSDYPFLVLPPGAQHFTYQYSDGASSTFFRQVVSDSEFTETVGTNDYGWGVSFLTEMGLIGVKVLREQLYRSFPNGQRYISAPVLHDVNHWTDFLP